eukprot:scaffold10792_cov18-Tisochrysis_lutea.AAC.1
MAPRLLARAPEHRQGHPLQLFFQPSFQLSSSLQDAAAPSRSALTSGSATPTLQERWIPSHRWAKDIEMPTRLQLQGAAQAEGLTSKSSTPTLLKSGNPLTKGFDSWVLQLLLKGPHPPPTAQHPRQTGTTAKKLPTGLPCAATYVLWGKGEVQ